MSRYLDPKADVVFKKVSVGAIQVATGLSESELILLQEGAFA
ncbi:MAG: hypothetical protein NTV32_03830 [Gammaproteobacteria bacterium]|jgi:hypothetical protein|nr:hypothetical protein [Gammaproteobacteria bacterium]